MAAAAVLALAVVLPVLGAAYEWYSERRDDTSAPPPGQMIDMGGYRMHLNCTGSGSPTVILESGSFVPAVGWNTLQPKVAKFTHVCSYDRAGYGYSDLSPRPRTQKEVARELHDLLAKAGVPGPYILVGHSYGGMVVQRYAQQFPSDVAGVMLMESMSCCDELPPITSTERFKAWESKWLTRLGWVRLRDSRKPVIDLARLQLTPEQSLAYLSWHFRAKCYVATFDEWDASHLEREPVSLGAIPMTVIVGSKSDASVIAGQRSFTAISTRSEFQTIPNSGHFMGIEAPDAVAAAIADLMRRGRGLSVGVRE